MEPDPLVTIGEAARRLGVSVDTARKWADEGTLASVRTVGGHRRFRLTDLDALLAGATTENVA